MGRPSTARTARARAFGRWSGGLCTHLDGEALIMLLKQNEEVDTPNDTAFESSLPSNVRESRSHQSHTQKSLLILSVY